MQFFNAQTQLVDLEEREVGQNILCITIINWTMFRKKSYYTKTKSNQINNYLIQNLSEPTHLGT